MSKIYNSVEDLVGHTPLVELNKLMKKFQLKANLIVKCEFYNPIFSRYRHTAKCYQNR